MRLEFQTEPVSAVNAAADFCPNCNEGLMGEYCYRCGEKRPDRARLSLKHFIGNSIRELADLEHSKILKTFPALVFKPELCRYR